MLMKKKIPAFKTDPAAAAFVDKADLTKYDLSGARLTRFEIKPKSKSSNLRLSRSASAPLAPARPNRAVPIRPL